MLGVSLLTAANNSCQTLTVWVRLLPYSATALSAAARSRHGQRGGAWAASLEQNFDKLSVPVDDENRLVSGSTTGITRYDLILYCKTLEKLLLTNQRWFCIIYDFEPAGTADLAVASSTSTVSLIS